MAKMSSPIRNCDGRCGFSELGDVVMRGGGAVVGLSLADTLIY